MNILIVYGFVDNTSKEGEALSGGGGAQLVVNPYLSASPAGDPERQCPEDTVL